MLAAMSTRLRLAPLVLALSVGTVSVGVAVLRAQAAVEYRLSFPEAEHRLMRVEVTWSDLPPVPLDLHMSRSSPGRYALHEFAKNVFDVRITDAAGRPLAVTRPNLHQWIVPTHDREVRVSYSVFGDRVDGTYLGVDSTHAHINMPAALMWASGLEDRAATIHFEPPAGAQWRAATQLFPEPAPNTFTAPNLQYLMDSPAELSALSTRSFSVDDGGRKPTFTIAVHHSGSDAALDRFAKDVEAIVREARDLFGEYPEYEGNRYTFIADYLPWVSGDGMEHRNSSILTSRSSIESDRQDLLDAVSHEFFHSWNVERIRPRSLEPFNLDEANVSGELWLAEGFTNYYGPLILHRTGLSSLGDFLRGVSNDINTVTLSPGRRIRSAEDMSRLAPFVDAATSIDRTNFGNLYVSYYTWGAAIALGLDLSLRDRSDGRVALDHFMRSLWQSFGKPGGKVAGAVGRPYTAADLKRTLASVSGDAAFADDFFARYIEGHELVDYERLLGRAGLLLRPRAPGRAFAGDLLMESRAGRVAIAAPVPFGSPAYDAGLERDDVILAVGDASVEVPSDVGRSIGTHRPGDTVVVGFERRGRRVTTRLRLIEDPRRELEPAENAGTPLTAPQRRFRAEWLSPAARTF